MRGATVVETVGQSGFHRQGNVQIGDRFGIFAPRDIQHGAIDHRRRQFVGRGMRPMHGVVAGQQIIIGGGAGAGRLGSEIGAGLDRAGTQHGDRFLRRSGAGDKRQGTEHGKTEQ